MRRPSMSTVLTVLVVGGASVFIFSQLQPNLLLTNTTPAGGDMGAHVWGPAYLRDHLLHHFRLSGWTPDWYAGFPWLTFYFPLPSALIVALGVLLPYGVAFKLVTVLGLVTLPIAAWAFGRLSGMRAPGPACLAVATLPFVFDRTFTIYGGNIPSTLAGEFAFSISLSLMLVFLGVVARGLETGRYRALAAGLLALVAACHIVPVFFALVGATVLTLLHLDRQRLRWTVSVLAAGGAAAAFWVLPFVMRIAYTNDMGWEKLVTYRSILLPAGDRWVVVLALGGAAASLVLRRRTGTFLTAMAAASAVAFVFAPQGRLWNARLLPFWVLCVYLLAGVAVAEAGGAIARVVGQWTEDGAETTRQLTPLVAMAAALVFVALPLQILPSWSPIKTADRSFIPDWARWNYSGYERKPAYPEYRSLVQTMADIGRAEGCGRAMWEYEPQLDRLGTPMALMLLPYWTKGCIGSMEGLFFESSATTPYHFLNQSELSVAPSRAQRALPYRDLDVTAGIQHLQLLGVRYYMALSDEAKGQAGANPDLHLLATSGPWSVSYSAGSKERTWNIYEVGGSAVVAPLAYEPAVMTGVPKGGAKWLAAATSWYQDASRWDVPLAAGGPKEWPRVQGADPSPQRVPVRPARVTNIKTGDDFISFDVDRPGTPVLVKASYFPNWQASGAKGVWRVTPNQMVVIPTSRHVRLHYGWTPVDGLSWLVTLGGLGALVWFRRSGPIDMPAPSMPATPDDALESELADLLARELETS